jgi:hypothetical protein
MTVHEFDFNNALGDTIMEKFEALYVALFKIHEEIDIFTVVGATEIISIFEVVSGTQLVPSFARLGELQYVARRSGRWTFDIFRVESAVKDELVLFGKKGNAVLKFVNFLI